MSSLNKAAGTNILTACAGIALLVANYFVFMVVPNEKIMGAVQRLFYFHVGSAIACYSAITVLLLAALLYLASRSQIADCFAVASTEVSFLFCTIVILSGMIWGRSAWNTWFRFEPRLVSFVLLWLILLAILLLRLFGDREKVAAQCAVLAILAAVNIPLVIFSVKLLPQSAQLHPQVLENRGLKDPSYWQAFAISVVALVLLQAVLILLRARVEENRRELFSKIEI